MKSSSCSGVSLNHYYFLFFFIKELDLKAALLDYLDGLPDVNPDDVFMTEEEWDNEVKEFRKKDLLGL